MDPTKFTLLNKFDTRFQEKIHAWDRKHGQKYMAREAIVPTEGPINVLLNGHVVKRSSKCLCFYP